jgi:pimeloyl-ACP methyl ester carboxylesterase
VKRSVSAAIGMFLGAQALGGCPSFYAGPLPGAPNKATYADVAGAHVRYVDRGQGPAVVLIHGFASSLETWDQVIPALEKDHRVLALDLKGFGWSDRPEGDYSPQAEASLVLALMNDRGIERAAVVGHSWGSSVALALAIAAPKRVSKLALYDAWVYDDQLPTFFYWARADGLGELLFSVWYGERSDERMRAAFFDKDRFVTEPFVEAVERALDRPGTRAAALAAARGQHFETMAAHYKEVAQPTLLLWGREDEVTTLGFGERLSHDLPHARLVVYPECGHFPMIEAANVSTRELATFLAEGAP